MRIPLLTFAALLCFATRVAAELPTSWVELAGERYRVELALDDHSRMRGLMFRESMAADAGMLFVFDVEYPQSFWMKNTLLPLDILYFDARGELVSVSADTPPCKTPYCPSYPSSAPAKYVLELNAGEAARIKLAPRAKLTFAPDIPGAPPN